MPSTWLVPGSIGDRVRDVQGLLYQAGLYNGAIDGLYLGQTEDAVKQWQRQVGATMDGIYGPQTQRRGSQFLATFNDASAVANGKRAVVPAVGSRYVQGGSSG